MTLKTGILTLIGENGDESELKTTGKVFRIGSYLSCDLVLDNPEARSIHCEIQSDSFGRITITNHSKSNPVRINGVPLKGTRPLYTGSVISIFEKSLKWVNKHRLPRNMVDIDKNQTPQRGFKRTDQAPNSEPSAFMRKKHAAKRTTMHNFGASKCLSDEDDADTFRDRNEENKRQDRLTRASMMSAAKTFGATPPRSACRSKMLRRTLTDVTSSTEMKDENNINTPEMKKIALLKCQSSGMVVTSYSPNATPKKINSFAHVISTKNTPNSAYETPRSVLSEFNSSECIESLNSTLKTPKDTCAMFLIDFTTPDVYRTPLQKRTPLFRSALKNSAAKSVSKGPIKDDLNSTTKSCTPSSVKRLRWNTSEVVMKSERECTPLQVSLNRSTPFSKSTVTPNKLGQSFGPRSVGKRSCNRLSQPNSETPSILTRRSIKTSSTKTAHSVSRLTPSLKRKSLNISSPLKTPKEIFSGNKSATPKNSRLSPLRNSDAIKSMIVREAKSHTESTYQSGALLDRSKTFILDGPSISQVTSENDIESHILSRHEIGKDANETFTCEDSELDIRNDSKLTETDKIENKVDLIEGCCGLEENLESTIGDSEISNQITSNTDFTKEIESSQQNRSDPSVNWSVVNADNTDLLLQGETIEESVHVSQRDTQYTYVDEKSQLLNSPTFEFSGNNVSNKFSQSLSNGLDKSELIEKEEIPRRRSLRRWSIKENITVLDESNTEITRNLSIRDSISDEEKSEDKTRKSLNLSRSNTNIESIAPYVEADNSDVSTQSLHTEAELGKCSPENKREIFNAQKHESTQSSPKLFAIKELMKNPKTPEDINLHGVKELMQIRKSFVGIQNVVGVKELFITPKKGGLDELIGVKELVKTPILNPGLADTKGVKELFNTPHRDDITNVFGVRELMNTPKSCTKLSNLKGMKEMFNTPHRDDLTDVLGVKELVNTPKPHVGLSNGVGLKELFNTPTRDDLTNVLGVKELLKTPVEERGFEDLKGVKEFFNTPSRNDISDVRGVKELFNTPKPVIGLVDTKGVKEIFKTPMKQTGIIDTKGLKELFNTPKQTKKLEDETPNVTIDTKIVTGSMKSPREISSSETQHLLTSHVSLYDDAGVTDDVFKTPSAREVMILSTPKSICVEKVSTSSENLLKTPKEINVLEDMDEVDKIFQTPVSNLNSEIHGEENVHLSPEESFDKLVGKPAVRRTYTRASVTPRILPIPIRSESDVDVAKTDIQEWIDNVNIQNNVEVDIKARENAIKSPIIKIHRKPLATSSSIKPTNQRRSTRLMRDIIDAELKEVSGIEQLEDSFLSSGEDVSDVFIDRDESSKVISVETTNEDMTFSRNKLSSHKIFVSSNTPQKSARTETSPRKHAVKDTPQIRRLRNRPSTPHSRKEMPHDRTKDPFADLSIQYIDESSLNASILRSKTPLRYKIRKSERPDDLSIELIDSRQDCGKQTKILNETSNDTTVGAEYISINETAEKSNSAMITRKSRKTAMRSGCVISISDEEHINDTKNQTKTLDELSKIEKSSKPACETLEFIAANELSVISANEQSLHSTDAFRSLNDSENITLIDVSVGVEDINEAEHSVNISVPHSASKKSLSYEEEEDKLLDIYETHLSAGELGDQSLGVLNNESNKLVENTNVVNEVDASDFEAKESTSITNDLKRQSQRYASQFSIAECLSLNDELSDCKKSTEIHGKTCSLENICGEDESITKKQSANSDAETSNEFANFVENPDRRKRVGDNSFTPMANTKREAKKRSRKTVGSASNSSPFDAEAEKMKLEFSNFDMNPKVMISRGTSQLDPKTSRMTISRRTTGKLPLNPNFNVQEELDRRNLSIEFQNFDSAGIKRSLRGRSLSPVKQMRVDKGRRTTYQQPMTNKSFDLDYELERRNMSLEFKNFESAPSSRDTIKSRSLASLNEKSSSTPLKNRFTMGQKSNNSFDYNAEVERRNISVELEHFNADERIAINPKRRTIGVNKAPIAHSNNRLSDAQNARSTHFDIKAEQERRKLNLEFKNFDENASQKTRTCGYSEAFNSSSNSTVTNNRRTLGARPLSESFDITNEVEKYHIEREFDNFNAEIYPTRRHRGQSHSPVKKSKVHPIANKRLTVGQPPLAEPFDFVTEKRRKELENVSTLPTIAYRGNSLSPPTCTKKHDFGKKRMTLGDRSNSNFDVENEKQKILELENSTKNDNRDFDFDANTANAEDNRKVLDQINSKSTSTDNEPNTGEEVVRAYVVVVDTVIDDEPNRPMQMDKSKYKNTEDEDDGTITSISKSIINDDSENDTRTRHVRFGENIYYEISRLESNDCKENQHEPNAVAQTKEKLPSKLRSRKTKKLEGTETIEKMTTNCIEAVTEDVQQNNAGNNMSEENKENVKNRRGKRVANGPQRKSRKLKASDDLEPSQLSKQEHQQEKLSDDGQYLINKTQLVAEVSQKIVGPEKLQNAAVENEINKNHNSDDSTTQNKIKQTVKTRRGRRVASSTDETDPETLDNNLKIDEGSSQKEERTIEGTIKQNSNNTGDEKVNHTRTRRGKATTARKVIIEEENKNAEDEETSSINHSGDETNAKKPVTRTKAKPSLKSTENVILDTVEYIPKTRNRRGKIVESTASAHKIDSEVEPVENKIANDNSERINTQIDITEDTTNNSSERQSSPLSEPILKIRSRRAEIKKTPIETDEELNEDKKPLKKGGRVRKIAQTVVEVRSSPRNKAKFLIAAQKTEQAEIHPESKTADVATVVTTSSKETEIAEPDNQLREEPKQDTDEENESKEKSVKQSRTRNARQNLVAENGNNSDKRPLKRSQRLVSTDVESEKNLERTPVDNSITSQTLEIESNSRMERKTRAENSRRKPLLEKVVNVESSPEILPAKRTRRLASHSDMASTNMKSTKGRAVRAANEDNNHEDSKSECTTVGEVFQTNDEEVEESRSSKVNPSYGVSNANDPSHSDPLPPRRTRRLVSVDEQPISVVVRGRTGRAKRKKEDSDSQNHEETVQIMNERPEEKSIEDTVFKTPNEVKPKRRGARLRSTNDTPIKDSSEVENSAPARRTRRLLSVEATSKDTPELHQDTKIPKTRATRLQLNKVSVLDDADQTGDNSAAQELGRKTEAPKTKSRRGQKRTSQSELPQHDVVIVENKIPSATENITNTKVQSTENVEEKTTRQTGQPDEVENDTVSKTTKQGRRTKRKAESHVLDVEEVVTRTRSRRK